MQQSQMLKGILEGCVLKVVGQGSCYSQEIIRRLNELGFSSISEGTLFPLLLRLDREGYFTTRLVSSTVGPSRKYYELNEAGRDELLRFTSDWTDLKRVVDRILEEAR